MGSKNSVPLDKHIVIVGGGYAGTKLAYALMKMEANFTLIDVKDSFVHNVANVRAIVEPDMAQMIYIDYAGTFKGYFKQARVSSISPDSNEVLLEGGAAVPYDVLVLATGTTAPFPTKAWDKSKEEGVKMFTEYCEKIKAADRIAIIGGGAVGTEIVAEIATDFPEKALTLVHPTDQLLRPGLRDATQKTLRKILDRMKVKLMLGQKVESNLDELGEEGPFKLILSNGETLEVDLVIRCTGVKVNTSAYMEGLGSVTEENGSLKVDQCLKVEGYNNIFAMGDCVNVAEMKLAVTAWNQADAVLHNLVAQYRGQPLKPYKRDAIPIKIAVSLGRNSGIGELKLGPILPEMAVKTLKSSHMFVKKIWKDLGRTPPQQSAL